MLKRIEVIDWVDHCGYGNTMWRSTKTIEELTPDPIRSVGFVIKETPVYVTIAAHVSGETNNVQGELCIVKSCITKRRSVPADPVKRKRRGSR